MTFDFSNPALYNPIYIPILYSDKRYILLYGSRDSGCSFFAGQLIVQWMLEYDYFKCVLLRAKHNKIKDSQFSTLKKIIKLYDLEKYFAIKENPLEIRCTLNNNLIIARGLDLYPESTKSVDDPTCAWYEEAIEIKLKGYIDSSLSLRNSYGTPLKEIFTFNAENDLHWTNKEFFPPSKTYERLDGMFNYVTSTNPDAVILHTTYKDNLFVTEDRIRRLESITDDHYYKVYVLGLWGGALKGLVFSDWSVASEFPMAVNKFGFGQDFGFSNHESALIRCGIYDRKIYYKEEFYETGLSNNDIAGYYKDCGIRKRSQGRSHEIWADSAHPKDISELWNYGYNIVGASKGPGSIETGIAKMKSFHIVLVDSPNLEREFQRYKYKETKDGIMTNTPVDLFNHCIDAGRYWALEKLFDGQKKNTTSMKATVC